MRVAMGFSALSLLLLNGALWLGFIPDRNAIMMQQRKSVAESMAISYSGMAQLGTAAQVQPVLEEMAHRTPGLLSVGVRGADGKLLIQIGDHEANWTNRSGMQSTETEMKVPLTLPNNTLGEIELRFTPLHPKSVFGPLHDDIVRLFAFMTIGGTTTYAIFVWIILHNVLTATSSEAIPRRIRDSLDTLAEGVLILDKQMRIILANNAFAQLMDRQPKDVEGHVISELPWIRLNDQDNGPYPWDQSASTGESHTGVLVGLQGKRHMPASLSVNSTPITGVDNLYRGVMLTFDNLSQIERKNRQLRRLADRLKQSKEKIQKQNQTLEFMATRDPLTECLNRRAFFAQLNTHWDAARRYDYPLCCIMVDIDHFKSVNDTHGHAVGDQAIKHVAKLMETGRRTSDIVGRYGGEEFVLLLPHIAIDDATLVAERIRQLIDATPCDKLHITVSMGVSMMSASTKDAGELLHQADEALYAAKHGGRNQVCRWDKLPPPGGNQPKEGAKTAV